MNIDCSMPKMNIDNPRVKRVEMMALAERLKNPLEADNITPIDIHSPEHLKHYFANGSYVREMILPANTIVVGRIHKYETINILLEGEITVVDEAGNRTDFKAPHVFVAPAGNQKAAITKTPVRWLNSFACDTTDPQEAIELLTCETTESYNKFLDSQDVKLLTDDLGMTIESMSALVDTRDVILDEQLGVYIGESEIDGIGLFAEKEIPIGGIVANMRDGDNRTLAGRYTNHSLSPNSKAEFIDGVLSLICIKGISQDEEITCNYREVLKARREWGDL